MLKAIRFLLKLTIFSTFVLILGNLIQWNGKTVSDQVKFGLAQAERSNVAEDLREWTGSLIKDAKKGVKKAGQRVLQPVTAESKDDSIQVDIPQSERQKLRALIRELNGTIGTADSSTDSN